MFSQIHTTVIYIQNDRFDSAESQNTLVCTLSGFPVKWVLLCFSSPSGLWVHLNYISLG